MTTVSDPRLPQHICSSKARKKRHKTMPLFSRVMYSAGWSTLLHLKLYTGCESFTAIDPLLDELIVCSSRLL
jgi:hypothetical protein